MRRAQRATWFPLLVFAAVTFAAIPAYHSGPVLAACAAVGAVPRVTTCTEYSLAGFVYWPIALVLAYVAIATFYIRRSQARGVGTRARPYVIAGIILALAMTGAALWTLRHPLVAAQELPGLPEPFSLPGPDSPPGPSSLLASYSCAIGLPLLVLAWAERNRALLVLALGYLAVVLVPITFVSVMGYRGSWIFLTPLVIDGSILLLGGIGFALAQRPWQRAA
ncbi:MAG TPA: hypothetical protein VNF47_24695 [Streptosporangiaceae bacterium]|nr:hypothetical protein [Streptosporangiaceae bacterium]